jgi:uncharacterized protein
MTQKVLTPHEARVLGTLMEKARTVPDSYPLTLNSLTIGCNQKTSREPLLELSDAEVQTAIDGLKSVSLVFEDSGGRVTRYEHNFQRIYGVNEPQAVLLGLLMLRGAQTPGELRINAERWYKFADINAVESILQSLQDASGERGRSFAQQLPRSPGAREQRWVHLLCGEPIFEQNMPVAGVNATQSAINSIANSEALNTALERIAALEQRVAHLEKELGVSQA